MFSLQNIPPAPGRPGSEAAPSAPDTQGPPPSQEPGIFGYLPLLLVAVMIPLLLFSQRSTAKKQAAAISALAKGDRVLLQGGLVGKVELSPGVKVDVLKNALLGKDSPETAAQAEKR